MTIIGTHDSATGERGAGLLSWLVTPFARTQSKTVVEQYKAGARYFDFRIRKHHGEWHCAHGLWRSKRTLMEMLADLESEAKETTWFTLTLESRGGDDEEHEFVAFAEYLNTMLRKYDSSLHLMTISVKLPKWRNVKTYENPQVDGLHHCFKTLDYRSWHTYIPIPWLWNKVYAIEPKPGYINSYDFL